MKSIKSLWALALVGISLQVFAQDPIAEKYAAEINTKIAKKHLSILASDKYEGRETGKAGAEKAAKYIVKEFKKLKLIAPVNGSYIQEVPLQETTFDVTSFSTNGQTLILGKDYLFNGSGDAQSISAHDIVFI